MSSTFEGGGRTWARDGPELEPEPELGPEPEPEPEQIGDKLDLANGQVGDDLAGNELDDDLARNEEAENDDTLPSHPQELGDKDRASTPDDISVQVCIPHSPFRHSLAH